MEVESVRDSETDEEKCLYIASQGLFFNKGLIGRFHYDVIWLQLPESFSFLFVVGFWFSHAN